jgi:hypothetical protein
MPSAAAMKPMEMLTKLSPQIQQHQQLEQIPRRGLPNNEFYAPVLKRRKTTDVAPSVDSVTFFSEALYYKQECLVLDSRCKRNLQHHGVRLVAIIAFPGFGMAFDLLSQRSALTRTFVLYWQDYQKNFPTSKLSAFTLRSDALRCVSIFLLAVSGTHRAQNQIGGHFQLPQSLVAVSKFHQVQSES